MKVILTGGGSGGHITPLLAVASELKQQTTDVKIIYIGQKGDKLGDIPARDKYIDETYAVRAGKFRRYHGEGWKQLLDVPTFLKNFRDVFYVLIGIFQSRALLKRIKPDIIFIKGGFVGVPVGLAAAQLTIPYITHDSDAIPGLANKLISRWAKIHTVALPVDGYPYPADRCVTTGIPLRAEFQPVDDTVTKRFRSDLGYAEKDKILFIIGGGLGAQNINHAVVEAVPHLLREFPELKVIHATGRSKDDEVMAEYQKVLSPIEQGRLKVVDYIADVYRYSGAADVIITRAGATNLAEFALQGKACIVIPSPFLAGGHQLKNAQYLSEHQAAAVLSEFDLTSDPLRLSRRVSQLLGDEAMRQNLAKNLARFAKPDAAKLIVNLILKS